MTDRSSRYTCGPGQVRLVGRPSSYSLPLVATDLSFDILQQDGTWVPLRGVTQYSLSVQPDQIAMLHNVSIELGLLDVTVLVDQVQRSQVILDTRPAWRRWRHRAQMFVVHFRAAWNYAMSHDRS